jgi:ATP phosphoribosyltransferase regulatory subunit
VGDLGDYEIAEVALLAAKSMALLEKDFVLDLSHMGLVEAVLNSCEVAPGSRDAVMRCLRQKNAHELTALCPGITPVAEEKLRLLLSTGGCPGQVIPKLQAVLTEEEEFSALQELQRLCCVLEQGGFGDSIRIDFSVGNDMKYYSGVVFKGYLEGLPSRILSGGQYDKLLQKMNRKSRAIGFALYLSMLERQNAAAEEWTVDTLILHSPDADPMELMTAAEQYAAEGSVLVATKIPQGRSWRQLIDMREGASAQ